MPLPFNDFVSIEHNDFVCAARYGECGAALRQRLKHILSRFLLSASCRIIQFLFQLQFFR